MAQLRRSISGRQSEQPSIKRDRALEADQRKPSIAMAVGCFERKFFVKGAKRRLRRSETKNPFRNFCWPLRSTAARDELIIILFYLAREGLAWPCSCGS